MMVVAGWSWKRVAAGRAWELRHPLLHERGDVFHVWNLVTVCSSQPLIPAAVVHTADSKDSKEC